MFITFNQRRIFMPAKKIIATFSILSIFAIALFIYPSTNQYVRAEQITSTSYKSPGISFQEAQDIIKTSQRIVASKIVIAQYFGKDIVDKILAQPGCVGVRMYYGKHANGKAGVIILGVDKYGKDISTGVLAMPSWLCPPYCGS
jgi:hypothetical protein